MKSFVTNIIYAKLKNMFSRERPLAHLEQTGIFIIYCLIILLGFNYCKDVGRLVSETLKRKPTYKIIRGGKLLTKLWICYIINHYLDTIFGIHFENLRDIPIGIKMMSDFIVDSGMFYFL